MYTMKLLQEQTKAKIFDEAGNTVKQLESVINPSLRLKQSKNNAT